MFIGQRTWLMTDKRRSKQGELKERLVEAAQARIARSGLAALRARDVTADVGSALGGLYNAFRDLDDLVLHVNAQTLGRLRKLAEARLAHADGPRAALQGLAAAYLSFAREHHALWAALFEFRVPKDRPLPDWFRLEQASLIELVGKPLEYLVPDMDGAARTVRARTLFGAIHGIVVISIERRFVGVPDLVLEGELTQFVDIIVTGMERSR